MKLVSILDEALIFHGVQGATRQEIYRNMLSQAAEVAEFEVKPELWAQDMIEREDALQIPYERVAFPHLRQSDFDDLHIIIGLPATPLQLKSCDCGACQIVVMSLISNETSDLYLKSLAAFSRFLMKPENIAQLAQTSDAEAFLAVLNAANVKIRSTLCAEDLISGEITALHPEDTLASALDKLTRDARSSLPVVDATNHLVGELTAQEVLRRFIPEYIFRMDNLDFLNSFEPFNKIFEQEQEQLVKAYMIPPRITVEADDPLIQFTAKMVRDSIRSCFVINPNGELIGEICLKDIVKKVLRG